jgi:hypothetical protein
MIYAKRHANVLAACDANLLGKRFEEKELVLDVKESFYMGELVEEDELAALLTSARNINLVGEKTIRVAKKNKMVGSIGRIKGVPYAMIFRL